jgi:putative transposase
MLIDPGHRRISLARQCALLDLARSTLYYRRSLPAREPPDDFLLRRIDALYTKRPFFGVRRMTRGLRKLGLEVNPKRVRRLMRQMGLEAIYPRHRLSVPAQGHARYPYLLRDLAIERPDQVWCADITYIRLRRGFVYLVAVMDWASRYVLAWRLSISLETGFCLEALEEALAHARPEIFNTDQGAQFTAAAFVGRLERAGIRVSMDGRGRVYDNIFVERLWRSVKYEEVYLHDYESAREADRALTAYFRFYNEERPHQALGYRTPAAVYADRNEPEAAPAPAIPSERRPQILLAPSGENSTLTQGGFRPA